MMWILTIIGIAINVIRILIDWFSKDLTAKNRVPTAAQSAKLAELRNLTMKFDGCCATYGIVAAEDGTFATAELE